MTARLALLPGGRAGFATLLAVAVFAVAVPMLAVAARVLADPSAAAAAISAQPGSTARTDAATMTVTVPVAATAGPTTRSEAEWRPPTPLEADPKFSIPWPGWDHDPAFSLPGPSFDIDPGFSLSPWTLPGAPPGEQPHKVPPRKVQPRPVPHSEPSARP